MIYVAPNRALQFSGVAADVVNDLITLDQSGEAIKMALCIHNCVGAGITFTNPMWAAKWAHRFGDTFKEKGIRVGPSTPKPRFVSVSEGVNLNAESIPASKPGDYEQIYTEEVQQHRSLFLPKR